MFHPVSVVSLWHWYIPRSTPSCRVCKSISETITTERLSEIASTKKLKTPANVLAQTRDNAWECGDVIVYLISGFCFSPRLLKLLVCTRPRIVPDSLAIVFRNCIELLPDSFTFTHAIDWCTNTFSIEKKGKTMKIGISRGWTDICVTFKFVGGRMNLVRENRRHNRQRRGSGKLFEISRKVVVLAVVTWYRYATHCDITNSVHF